MGKEIEEKVIQMDFKSSSFDQKVDKTIDILNKLKIALNLNEAAKTFSAVDQASKKVDLSPIGSAAEAVGIKFSAMQVAAVTAMSNIVNSAVNKGKEIATALSITPPKEGFKEYETQINAVQTILANTSSKGTTLSQVNSALDELNTYADKTIYNFTEMTRNIGTFTAAGTDLKTSTAAIQGIANVAALSGSNSQQASTAMYQLSQAMASGTVKLMDWNSVVNAGMGGAMLQEALKKTARSHGIAVDEMIKKNGSFRDSLQEGWITTEVLTDTLKGFTTSGVNEYIAKNSSLTQEAIKKIREESSSYEEAATAIALKSKMSKTEIQQMIELSQVAEDAATKVKTFTQLKDTIKEAVQSGWTQTWEILIGDFEEAKELFTNVSNALGKIISKSSNARNDLLTASMTSGWEKVNERINSSGGSVESFKEQLKVAAKNNGVSIDELIKKNGSLEKSFSSGWMNQKILMEAIKNTSGITEESLKELSDASSTANKELTIGLDTISRKSGRQMAIESITNAIQGLLSILNPIKAAWEETFPKASADKIYNIIYNILELSKSLKLSQEQMSELTDTFQGLFTVIKIIGRVIGVILKLVAPAFGIVGKAISIILNLTGVMGRMILKFDKFLTVGEVFVKINQKIAEVFTTIQNKAEIAAGCIEKFKQSVSSKFDSSGFSAFSGFIERIGQRMSGIIETTEKSQNLFAGLGTKIFTSENVEKAGTVVANILSKLYTLAGNIAEAISNVFQSLSDSLSNINFNSLLDGINAISFGGLVLAMSSFLKSVKKGNGFLSTMSKMVKGLPKVGESFARTLDGLRGCLEAYQAKLKADALNKIAKAIGILALSLLIVSLIDSDKMTKAVAGISTLFAELVGSMAVLSKISGKNIINTIKIIAMMTAMSISILVLATALKLLSTIPFEQAMDSLLIIGGLMGMMTVVAKVLAKNEKRMMAGMTGLLFFATAVKILTGSVIELSTVPYKSLIKGLLAVAGLMAVVLVFANNSKRTKNLMSTALGLTIIAKAISILSESVVTLGNMSKKGLIKGIGAIGSLLIMLAAFSKGASGAKKMISIGIGMMLLGRAIEILTGSLLILAGVKFSSLAKGVLIIASALGAVALMTTLMPKDLISKSIGLILISKAIASISETLISLSGVSKTSLAKSLISLAVSLGILSLGIASMKGSLKGAFALMIAAAALNLLAPALGIIGSLSLITIGKSLLALAATFTLLGIAGYSLGPALPVIIGISGAIALIGAAVLGVGAGLTLAGIGVGLLATGITALAISVTAGTGAIVASLSILILGFLGLIPQIVLKLGEGFLALIAYIGTQTPVIVKAIVSVVTSVCQAIIILAPVLVNTILFVVLSILQLLLQYTPQIISTAIGILVALLQGLTEGIPEIVKVAVDMVVAFILALGSQVFKVVDAAFRFIISFINGLCDALDKNSAKLGAAVGRLMGTIIKSMFSILGGAIGSFVDIGKNLITGFIDGITSMIGGVEKAIKKVANGAISGIKNFLGIHSPSRVFKSLGQFTIQGLVNGITDKTKAVSEATKDIGKTAVGVLKTAIAGVNHISEEGFNISPVISPIVDLADVNKKAKSLSGLFTSDLAIDKINGINSTMSETKKSNLNIQNGQYPPGNSQVEYNFNQYNTSPKALSRTDIYRQTKNQFAMLKGVTVLP